MVWRACPQAQQLSISEGELAEAQALRPAAQALADRQQLRASQGVLQARAQAQARCFLAVTSSLRVQGEVAAAGKPRLVTLQGELAAQAAVEQSALALAALQQLPGPLSFPIRLRAARTRRLSLRRRRTKRTRKRRSSKRRRPREGARVHRHGRQVARMLLQHHRRMQRTCLLPAEARHAGQQHPVPRAHRCPLLGCLQAQLRNG